MRAGRRRVQRLGEAAWQAEDGQGPDAGAPAGRPVSAEAKLAVVLRGEECEHSAGGVYRRAADGGGVSGAVGGTKPLRA